MDHNPIFLTIEFVKKLRAKRRPELLSDPSKGIPTSTLRWLVERMNIDSSMLFIYLSTGRQAIRKNIGGNNKKWGTLEEERQSSDDEKKLFSITCRLRGKHHLTDPIGYLGVYRSGGFNEIEIDALQDIAQFLGDYMYEIFYINRLQYHKNGIQRIQEICKWDKKPGTIIKHTQGTVTRAMRAYASYFAVINDNTMYIEYFQKPSWNRPRFEEVGTPHNMSKMFYRLCNKTEFFQWVDLGNENRLDDILQNYAPTTHKDWEYLIAVNKDDGMPIAIWIFQFSKNQLVFNDLYKDLILFGIEKVLQSVHYLYQRRIKQLIVNPIFRHRDTKVDKELAFIIMPFSESWSNRIWKKFIRPIVSDEGLRAIRADDLYGRDIMEDIWKGLLNSRIIIADITSRNPNVFYELGIAHTIGKEVVLLTQKVEDIPFDLNRYRHIIYQDNQDGYEKLEVELKATIRDILQS